MLSIIDSFRGEHAFLSNFANCSIRVGGINYKNAEACFQAMKLKENSERVMFSNLTGGEAKKLGRRIELRSDWEDIKLKAMKFVVETKFKQNPELGKRLLETQHATLVEGNNWGDKYWGMCNGVGENNLGRILMLVREEIKKC